MKPHGGFTLVENMLGVFLLLVVAVSIVPAFYQLLVLGNVQWERRQAMKVIERTLEQGCSQARTAAGFASLTRGSLPGPGFPADLASATRTVTCVDGISAPTPNQDCTTSASVTRKRLDVTVQWMSKGRLMSESSAPYVMSRTGVCGVGP